MDINQKEFLTQASKEIFIWRNMLYRSAQYYKIRNRWTGWPPSFIAGLLSLLKSADFLELELTTDITLKIISLFLTLLIFLWSTVHMLLGNQKKMQKCKDLADNLYDIEQDINAFVSVPTDPIVFIERIKRLLSDYNRSMGLLPSSIYIQYYPNSRKELTDVFNLVNDV